MDLVAGGVPDRHQRFVDQPAQGTGLHAGYTLGRLPRKAVLKHREAHECLAVGPGQMLPGVLERRTHAPLALRQIGQRARQKIEVVGNLVGDFLEREHLQPARGQHQGQGSASHQAADARGLADIVRSKVQVGTRQPAQVDQQLHGAMIQHIPAGAIPGIGHAPQRIDALTAQVQTFARRHQDLDLWRRLQDLGYEPCAGHHVVKVVQQQEHTLPAQIAQQLLLNGCPCRQTQSDLFGQRRQEMVLRRQGAKADEIGTVGEYVPGPLRRLQGQPRLADAPWPGDDQQAAVWIVGQQRADLFQIPTPPDKGLHRRRQVAWRHRSIDLFSPNRNVWPGFQRIRQGSQI